MSGTRVHMPTQRLPGQCRFCHPFRPVSRSTLGSARAQQRVLAGRSGSEEDSHITRRATLLQVATAAFAGLAQPTQASTLWRVGDMASNLPKGYAEVATHLVQALRTSIEADLPGAEDREVRRRAEPAKALVRTWVLEWQDKPAIREEVSYKQITATLQQLGEYYKAKGSRARLTDGVRDELLFKLDAAELALPIIDERKFNWFN